MSAFRGILTGFGMAAIKDKEAKDNARMEVVKAAGLDYVTNQLPQHKKTEENRAQAYKQLTTMLGSEEAADYFDANGFITGDGKDVERIQKMLEDKEIKPDAFKNYIPTSNYSDRYNTRQSDFETRFDLVNKNFNIQGSGIGPSTIKGLLSQEEGDITKTETVTTPGVEGSQVGPVVTEAIPEKTEEITTTIPRTTADTALSAFFVPKTSVPNLGKESDIAAAVMNYRGFDKGISYDPVTKTYNANFAGVKNTEYLALKQVINDIAPQFEMEDGKTNLTAAAEAADRQLTNQTQGFTSELVNNFKETTDSKGETGSTGGGFKESFFAEFPTVKEQKKFLVDHMSKQLLSKSEMMYYALNFPSDVTFSDGKTNVRDALIAAVR
jgi:hypothetical protein